MAPRGPTSDPPSQYEFRISGRLDRRWESWFEGLTIIHEHDHTTTLRGGIADQAALHGVLGRLRDLGIALISMRVVDVPPDPPTAPGGAPIEGQVSRRGSGTGAGSRGDVHPVHTPSTGTRSEDDLSRVEPLHDPI